MCFVFSLGFLRNCFSGFEQARCSSRLSHCANGYLTLRILLCRGIFCPFGRLVCAHAWRMSHLSHYAAWCLSRLPFYANGYFTLRISFAMVFSVLLGVLSARKPGSCRTYRIALSRFAFSWLRYVTGFAFSWELSAFWLFCLRSISTLARRIA